jgi:hypothetical protein
LTWPRLKKYMGADPEISQEQTKVAYRKSVDLYLDSFDKWSAMIKN